MGKGETMKTLDIGSISHGTLRAQDLAEALRFELSRMTYRNAKLYDELDAIAHDEGRDEEYDSEVINDAIDALQDYAPMFCYVGFHPGDGSDLGCWPDHDAIESAVREGDAIKIDDLSDLDSLAISELCGANVAILVNDHGNMTVYELSIKATRVWDCV
jgi:hypothetical protein